MLPREHRLRLSSDFARVRREGRAWSHPWLVVTAVPNGGRVSRVGFTVSKRVGKAHVRNLVRRRLREAMRAHLPHLAPGYDIVIISRPALAAQPYAALAGALAQQLRHARLLSRAARS
ncbi:MAG TPA: ribonuclease P protein component [Chloroflexota bacterium]|nr:ribonuclease P protein component [Chloroflexota bacterium]